eukprot:11120645-Prorocentrum_lima.AAC.1
MVYLSTPNNLHIIWSPLQIWRQPDEVNESLNESPIVGPVTLPSNSVWETGSKNGSPDNRHFFQ